MNPDDLPWEEGVSLPNLAPRSVAKLQARVRGPNPEAQRRGRNNRKRGARAERELVRIFETAGWVVLTQSGPNRRDMVADCNCTPRGTHRFSVECKSMTDRWPRPAEVAKAWGQTIRQAGLHWPLLVFCLRHQGKPTQWRRYTPDGFEELSVWLQCGSAGARVIGVEG